jgi:hypothetical protein
MSNVVYFALVAAIGFAWLIFLGYLTTKVVEATERIETKQTALGLALVEMLELQRGILERTGISPFDSETPFDVIKVEPNSPMDKFVKDILKTVDKRRSESNDGAFCCIGCRGLHFPNPDTCGICAQARGRKGPAIN